MKSAVVDRDDISFTRRAFRAFWPLVRPSWRTFMPPLVATVLGSALALLKPWPLKFLIDDVLHVGGSTPASTSTGFILAIGGAIVAIAVLQGLLGFIESFYMAVAGQRVAFRMRTRAFGHLQRLSTGFHDRQRTGDLMTRVTTDVTRVQETITDWLLVGALTSLLQLVGMTAVMLVLNWRLGLVALISVPLVTFTAAQFRHRIRSGERRVRQREGQIASLAQEAISQVKLVKAFGREGYETRRFEREAEEMLDAGIRVTRLESGFSWALQMAAAVSLCAVVVIGAHEVVKGALSAGVLVVFIQYMKDLQGPLLWLTKLTGRLAKVRARAERIVEILDEQPTVRDRPDAVRAPRFRGAVEFDGVTVSYVPGQPVLHDVSLRIEPGETVAIVGPTGAGKSTLASLLLRLHDPDQGTVLIDGRDIREYTLESLLAQSAIVLQESLLFQTTILENIAYGRPEASREEIEAAARVAHCDEFIRRLPDGLLTVVGERGGTVSGGQRQRIAIARALIRDAPILILDEPTTGLDMQAEDTVMRALERLMAGRTTIMIAHRLPTVRRADRICVLEGGRIVEVGTHDELVASGGWYASTIELDRHGDDAATPLSVNGSAVAGQAQSGAYEPAGVVPTPSRALSDNDGDT